MAKNKLKKLLAELKAGLTQLYDSQLKGLYLFGSYARATEDSESDLDLLIILKDFKNYGAEVSRTSQLISDLSLKYDISISSVFARESEWLKGENPFFKNIRREAIAA